VSLSSQPGNTSLDDLCGPFVQRYTHHGFKSQLRQVEIEQVVGVAVSYRQAYQYIALLLNSKHTSRLH